MEEMDIEWLTYVLPKGGGMIVGVGDPTLKIAGASVAQIDRASYVLTLL